MGARHSAVLLERRPSQQGPPRADAQGFPPRSQSGQGTQVFHEAGGIEPRSTEGRHRKAAPRAFPVTFRQDFSASSTDGTAFRARAPARAAPKEKGVSSGP